MARFTAQRDHRLAARVISSSEMIYADGPSQEEDRPPHVLAASGLSNFREYLAVIQDDANWLALIDAEQRISAVPLPPYADGSRVFTKRRGNQQHKCDLEACIAVPGDHGLELIGFGSGSELGREWILRVREVEGESAGASSEISHKLAAELFRAETFYQMLRARTDFCGAGLNIEGAVAVDGERVLLFQRGNAQPTDEFDPVDAIAELSWSELRRYLADAKREPPPQLVRVDTYELGVLQGVRLTFSDAEHLGGGRILYSASAEDRQSGKVAGSVLGVIEADGEARWTELQDVDGKVFTRKIEGLTRDMSDASKVHFVIDDDDDNVPSKVFQAILSGPFFDPSL